MWAHGVPGCGQMGGGRLRSSAGTIWHGRAGMVEGVRRGAVEHVERRVTWWDKNRTWGAEAAWAAAAESVRRHTAGPPGEAAAAAGRHAGRTQGMAGEGRASTRPQRASGRPDGAGAAKGHRTPDATCGIARLN
jgi:hypothetical protein